MGPENCRKLTELGEIIPHQNMFWAETPVFLLFSSRNAVSPHKFDSMLFLIEPVFTNGCSKIMMYVQQEMCL